MFDTSMLEDLSRRDPKTTLMRLVKLSEELNAELGLALLHYIDSEAPEAHVLEELADVIIVLDSIRRNMRIAMPSDHSPCVNGYISSIPHCLTTFMRLSENIGKFQSIVLAVDSNTPSMRYKGYTVNDATSSFCVCWEFLHELAYVLGFSEDAVNQQIVEKSKKWDRILTEQGY